MDAVAPHGRKERPQGAWKTAKNAVSHSAHSHLSSPYIKIHGKTGARADQVDECQEFVSFRRPLTPRRRSGFSPRKNSGLSHDIVRSSPGSPASTPNRAHSPATCVARRSSSPNSLALILRSKPRQFMTSHDVFDSSCPRLSDSIVTVLPAIRAVRALSSVARGFPTRSFSHRRYLVFSATNQPPAYTCCPTEHVAAGQTLGSPAGRRAQVAGLDPDRPRLPHRRPPPSRQTPAPAPWAAAPWRTRRPPPPPAQPRFGALDTRLSIQDCRRAHRDCEPRDPPATPRSSRPPGRTADEGRASATRGSVHHLTLAILGLVKLPMSSRNS